MKKTLITTMLLAIASMAGAFDFSATVDGGKTLYFTITSTSAMTVKVDNPNWDTHTKPSGHLSIPATVSNGTSTYSVTEIAGSAFAHCSELTHVSIAEGITTIGSRAFLACSALDTIELPSTLNVISNMAFNGTGYVSKQSNWVDNNKMLYIGDYLIQVRNDSQDTATVREGTIGIAGMAVYNCVHLSGISLPSTLTFIGSLAFSDCEVLHTVHLLGTQPPSLSDDSFNNTSDVNIIVPCGSLSSYTSNSLWAQQNIVEDTCSSIPGPGPEPHPVPHPLPFPIGIDDNAELPSIEVTTTTEGIRIAGVDGIELRVSDMMGRNIATISSSANTILVPLPSTGVYVVYANGMLPRKIVYCK